MPTPVASRTTLKVFDGTIGDRPGEPYTRTGVGVGRGVIHITEAEIFRGDSLNITALNAILTKIAHTYDGYVLVDLRNRVDKVLSGDDGEVGIWNKIGTEVVSALPSCEIGFVDAPQFDFDLGLDNESISAYQRAHDYLRAAVSTATVITPLLRWNGIDPAFESSPITTAQGYRSLATYEAIVNVVIDECRKWRVEGFIDETGKTSTRMREVQIVPLIQPRVAETDDSHSRVKSKVVPPGQWVRMLGGVLWDDVAATIVYDDTKGDGTRSTEVVTAVTLAKTLES